MDATTRGTMSGIGALVMWSALVGLIRSVTDAFGVAGGTALMYTVGALVLFLRNGMPKVRTMPKAYLFGVGALFVVYELALSQGVGKAQNARQVMEVGMLNYLWPCLTVLFSMWINRTKLRWLVWPGTALAVVGLYWCVASNGDLDLAGLGASILATPLPYALGLIAAITWALYCNFSVLCAKGHNAVPIFFATVAVVLWIGFFVRGGEMQVPRVASVAQLLALGAIVGFSYSMWETGIHHGNFLFLAVCSYFSPAASALFSAIWLGEMPGWGFWAGVGMVVAGSLLCWLANSEKAGPVH